MTTVSSWCDLPAEHLLSSCWTERGQSGWTARLRTLPSVCLGVTQCSRQLSLALAQQWCLPTPSCGFSLPTPCQIPALPSLPTYFYSCSEEAWDSGRAAMAASASQWHNYLGVIVSHEKQRLEHFQQAENILLTLLTLLEGIHAREPRFLIDYARNLEAFEFTLCASEDAVTMEIPLRIDGDALQVLACWPGDTPAGHRPELGTCCLEVPSPGTDLEDWTSAVGVMERGGGAGCLVPGKVLQHLKDLLVSAIVHCQRHFLLQPGAYTGGALPQSGAASRTAREPSSVVVPVQTGWGVSPRARGPPKACTSERAPCWVLGQALPSAKGGEMQTTPCHPMAAESSSGIFTLG